MGAIKRPLQYNTFTGFEFPIKVPRQTLAEILSTEGRRPQVMMNDQLIIDDANVNHNRTNDIGGWAACLRNTCTSSPPSAPNWQAGIFLTRKNLSEYVENLLN